MYYTRDVGVGVDYIPLVNEYKDERYHCLAKKMPAAYLDFLPPRATAQWKLLLSMRAGFPSPIAVLIVNLLWNIPTDTQRYIFSAPDTC